MPVLVDGDTGYGEALNVMHMVRCFEEAGAGAVHLEDQLLPKKCGHLNDKKLAPVDEMSAKVAAARKARRNLVVIARTDAVAVEGLDAALERAERYLECGVDALFIEALRSDEQMNRACAQFAKRVPLLANMVEGGKTPVQSAAELGGRVFKIVIFPGGTARAVLHTLQGYYASLHTHQTTRPWQEKMLDFDGLNAVIETPQLLALGQSFEQCPPSSK